MQKQRELGRAGRQENESMKVQGGPLADLEVKSEFVGYTDLLTEAKVVAIVAGDALVESVGEGQMCQVVLDKTPFYAESGGQVSDQGLPRGAGVSAKVQGLFKAPLGQHVHLVNVESGELRVGDVINAEVDSAKRGDIIKNHTATHLSRQGTQRCARNTCKPGRIARRATTSAV